MTSTITAPRSRDLDSLTGKIAKLLNQAEHAGTVAESEVFMAKAQELATLHSIDLAKARHATIAKQRTTPVQRTIVMGVRGTRGLSTLVSLFSGIARANDITCDIATNSTRVYAYGFAEDIDIAEALFASLSVQMSSAVEDYRRSGTWQGEWTWVPGRYCRGIWIEGHHKPLPWISARLDFQQGFAERMGRRLKAAREAAEHAPERDTEDGTRGGGSGPGEPGTAVVLAAKRQTVQDYYRRASTARGSYRGTRSATSSAARGAGARAADAARLSQSDSLPGARRSLA
jgi:hypothetical protein